MAYLFRDYARKIHARARPNDPSFIKLAVLSGRVRLLPSPPFLPPYQPKLLFSVLRSNNGPNPVTLPSFNWDNQFLRTQKIGKKDWTLGLNNLVLLMLNNWLKEQ